MTTLTEFLLARIAEDETVANQARDDGDGRWSTGSHPSDECRIEGDNMIVYDEGGHTEAQASHIARHDPARVLAECEAKRRIVESHAYDEGFEGCVHDMKDDWPCPTLCLLALPYADHADYRDEWRP
jgi:hypothetical protein